MIIYPTFDRSIRLHIQFFDEKFSADQFVFILPIPVGSNKINSAAIFATPTVFSSDTMFEQLPAKTFEWVHHIFT